MIKRFRKITDGLYRGSAPSVKDVVKLHKLFGIKKIVSLDEAAGHRIDRICKILNIEHVQITLDGTKHSLIKLLSYNIKDLLTEGGPTFIHCAEGKDRTGFLAALFKNKYMGVPLHEALDEAKRLGFGENVDPEVIKLFVNTLNKICGDTNSADIVEHQREYMQDGRSSALDHAERGSFAPYIDKTKQYPYDSPYSDTLDQYPTRENLRTIKLPDPTGEVPQVGMFEGSPGAAGAGFVEPGAGHTVNI
jgi:hypothetical protein